MKWARDADVWKFFNSKEYMFNLSKLKNNIFLHPSFMWEWLKAKVILMKRFQNVAEEKSLAKDVSIFCEREARNRN